VWKNFGYNMLIFIAGLQNIPDELYEASQIDGAGAWRQFIKITIPMLAPTTVFVVMITIIGYFQLFAEPYVMTQGGPLNSTMSIVLLMYEQGFRWWSMGYAAAIAFVLFAIILAFTLLQFVDGFCFDHESRGGQLIPTLIVAKGTITPALQSTRGSLAYSSLFPQQLCNCGGSHPDLSDDQFNGWFCVRQVSIPGS
jgi:hypothetical protein